MDESLAMEGARWAGATFSFALRRGTVRFANELIASYARGCFNSPSAVVRDIKARTWFQTFVWGKAAGHEAKTKQRVDSGERPRSVRRDLLQPRQESTHKPACDQHPARPLVP
jgi:hypothetical protein